MPLQSDGLHLESYRAVVADLEQKRDSLNELIAWLRNFYEPKSKIEPTIVANPVAPKQMSKRQHRIAVDTAKVIDALPNPTHRQSPVQDAILQVLMQSSLNGNGKPLTSIEVLGELEIIKVKTTAASVYSTLYLMAGKGTIKRTLNEEGKVAWEVVK